MINNNHNEGGSMKKRWEQYEGKIVNFFWDEDFDEWVVNCIEGTRKFFSANSEGFPVDVSKYGEKDCADLELALVESLPNHTIVHGTVWDK